MKIQFLGGIRTVTGTCFYLESSESKMLIDCGMFQGENADVIMGLLLFKKLLKGAWRQFQAIERGEIQAVDGPQTRILDRPVRLAGMCRLRKMHNMVSCRN